VRFRHAVVIGYRIRDPRDGQPSLWPMAEIRAAQTWAISFTSSGIPYTVYRTTR